MTRDKITMEKDIMNNNKCECGSNKTITADNCAKCEDKYTHISCMNYPNCDIAGCGGWDDDDDFAGHRG